ncbi:MAG: hypothetical protein ACI4NA_00895 [Succinivibrio sp.]
MARKLSQAFSVRNEDGSLSVFRLCCLLVLAACMLAYGIMLAAGGSSGEQARKASGAAGGTASSAPSAPEAGAEEEATAEGVRAMAFRELDDADEYHRECGTVNDGFVGCSWKFSPAVSKYYEGRSVAADDGFAITLSAKPENPDRGKCAVLEVTSGGERTSLDEHGKASLCFPAEKPQVASASGAAAAGDAGKG